MGTCQGCLFLEEGQFDLCFRFVSEMESIFVCLPTLTILNGSRLDFFPGKIEEKGPGKNDFPLAQAAMLCTPTVLCWAEPPKTCRILKQNNYHH